MSRLGSKRSQLRLRRNNVRISLQCSDCTPVPNSPVKLAHKSKQSSPLEQRRGFIQTPWAASRERGGNKTGGEHFGLKSTELTQAKGYCHPGRNEVFGQLVSLLHCMLGYCEMLRADSWACSTYSWQMKAFLRVFQIWRENTSLINVQMHFPTQLAR